MKRPGTLWAAMSFAIATISIAFAQTGPSPSPDMSPGIINLATPIAGQVTVMVPKDQMLIVKSIQSLNSYSAHQGERIRYEVVQDFIVGGYLIARAGDIAEGAVQEGQAGDAGIYGFGYKAANLRISIDRVFTYCGSTVSLAFDRSEYRRRQGFLGGHKDVEVTKGQKYAPFPTHPQQACVVKTDAQPQPIPSDVLRADKG